MCSSTNAASSLFASRWRPVDGVFFSSWLPVSVLGNAHWVILFTDRASCLHGYYYSNRYCAGACHTQFLLPTFYDRTAAIWRPKVTNWRTGERKGDGGNTKEPWVVFVFFLSFFSFVFFWGFSCVSCLVASWKGAFMYLILPSKSGVHEMRIISGLVYGWWQPQRGPTNSG